MNQKTLIGLALLVIGIILLAFGFNASNSPSEELAETLTGRYSDETMFYFIGGAVAAVLGVALLIKK